jgi:hypothetical protein
MKLVCWSAACNLQWWCSNSGYWVFEIPSPISRQIFRKLVNRFGVWGDMKCKVTFFRIPTLWCKQIIFKRWRNRSFSVIFSNNRSRPEGPVFPSRIARDWNGNGEGYFWRNVWIHIYICDLFSDLISLNSSQKNDVIRNFKFVLCSLLKREGWNG